MSDKDGKTQKPTPRKRKEARDEGQVARSQELPVAVSLMFALVSMQTLAPTMARLFGERTQALFLASGTGELPLALLKSETVVLFLSGVVPFLMVAVLGGVLANVAQVGLKLTPKAAKPKLSKISPKQGLQKFKLKNAGWEFLRTAIKLGILVVIVWDPISTVVTKISSASDVIDALAIIGSSSLDILWRAAAVMSVIAAVDFGVNKWKHEEGLKMSREDIRQEMKNSEGDPLIKAQRRKRAMQVSRNRMLAAVGEADVVITNPTHFAVALSYKKDQAAPTVIAKGTDAFALKIRHEAYRHGVHVMENPPLARALYKRVQVGYSIPADLYEAVAVVLAVVYRIRSRRARNKARLAQLANGAAPAAEAVNR